MLGVFGCEISYYDAFPPSKEVERELRATLRTAGELFEQCDVISIHVPVLPDTIGMVNEEVLARMKPDAVIVNAARGEIIDQYALADALEKGVILGAAIDTMSPEPPPSDHPLLNLSDKAKARLCLTPHTAGTTDEAFARMLDWAIANFMRAYNGEVPINIVNK
jgi:phosphoglycerate dehydrogenase-like enzyme